jgi:hypothetical protein
MCPSSHASSAVEPLTTDALRVAESSLAAASSLLAEGYLRVLRRRAANCQQRGQLGASEIAGFGVEYRCYVAPAETYVVVSQQDRSKKEMT